ncbi:plasmid partitioning protein RepB C-terminal domain-containing protein [Paraburkholderia bannensis]|uniref:plasmid partitioning protein RepB C-terminal domain-containing protein n=1 Tax=Paraburkholderia bannensis TaxID=765414 RepID=UPI002AB78076|nr:plasmid partitioning protein RepB C-terminal domain-containing protein [Paraburkholderia bannensis]
MTGVILGFVPEPIVVAIDDILPTRKFPSSALQTRKFRQIVSSISEVGLIEPLSVTARDEQTQRYTLLDGHLRLLALRELSHADAACLVATDDEAYTYNNRVNRLATVQEHYMIRKAIDRGVAPIRLAKALGVDVNHLITRITMLDGLCPEAISMLKDQQFSPSLSKVLRKMKPTRQVECVELMVAANCVTASYANALLVATPASALVEGKKSPRVAGMTQEQLAKMEREMSNLQAQYKLVEQTYGQDVLNLVLARGYLGKLLENSAITKYLGEHYPELLRELEAIVEVESIDQKIGID